MAAMMKLQVDVRVHARLDRPRRGRADPPAGRACCRAAADSAPRRLASGGHERDGGRVGAAIDRNRGRAARRAAPEPPELAYLEKTIDAGKIAASVTCCAYCPRRPPCRKVVLIAHRVRGRLAVDAAKALAPGHRGALVSMPSTSVFDARTSSYKASVLPAGVPRVAIEAGVTDFWWKYVRADGAVIGVDDFGESAPASGLRALPHHRRQHRRDREEGDRAEGHEPGGTRRRGAATGQPRRSRCAPVASSPVSTPDFQLSSITPTDHDHQRRHQRLRPHRPQHPARALRRRQEARHRRSSRSTTSATSKTNAHLTRTTPRTASSPAR